jgi:DNA-damage-inducible protein J
MSIPSAQLRCSLTGNPQAIMREKASRCRFVGPAAVLAAMGLTISDAFRLLMVRVAKEKALPFEPLSPNAKAIRAMKEARKKS